MPYYKNSKIFLVTSLFLVFLVLTYILKPTNFQYGKSIIFGTKHQARFVFFDLGANNGDSVLLFFEMAKKGATL